MQTKPHQKRDPIHINEITNKGKLGKILNKVQLIQNLNTTLLKILPSNIRPHCQVVNIEGFQMVIGCKNASIANAIYYQQNTIIDTIKQTHPEFQINNLRTKVYL